MHPRNFTLLGLVAMLGSLGCAPRYYATIYNNSGNIALLKMNGDRVEMAKGSSWYGLYYTDAGREDPTEHPPSEMFGIDLDGEELLYTKRIGPVGCIEFPSPGPCNNLVLEADGSIWYRWGDDPQTVRAKGAYPQPSGFPMLPVRRPLGADVNYRAKRGGQTAPP